MLNRKCSFNPSPLLHLFQKVSGLKLWTVYLEGFTFNVDAACNWKFNHNEATFRTIEIYGQQGRRMQSKGKCQRTHGKNDLKWENWTKYTVYQQFLGGVQI